MEAAQSSGALTLWSAAANPDDDVRNAFGIRAAMGELFMNTNNNALFFCSQEGTGTQVWQPMAYINTSQASASRALNTAFQVSADRFAYASYSVSIGTSISISGGQSGSAILEIATDSGFTTNVQELGRINNNQTGTLTIGLALSQNITGNLSGSIPPGYYARIRTVNNTGTPSFSYVSGQETLL